jgi:PIN like domain
LSQLTFYFDVCFGKRFPQAIEKAKPPLFSVEYHGNKNNRFKQDMPDDKWLALIGKKGWIVFSHDRRFHKESASVAAIKYHNIGCFYLPGANLDTWSKMFMFMKAHSRIIELAQSTTKPFVFHVTALNKVEPIDIGG